MISPPAPKITMANAIGIEQLKTFLQDYVNVISIDIFSGSKKTSDKPIKVCRRDKGDLIDQVVQFFTTFAIDDNKNSLFTLIVKVNPSESKITELVQFTFQMEKKEIGLAVNGTPMYQQQTTDPKLFELYSEVGFLRAENKRLQAENEKLNFEIAEMDAELSEAAEIGAIEDPIEKYLPMFMPMLGKLFGAPTNTVNGVEDMELSGIISELQNIDPNFKQNMFLLLKLAKNKPTIYKMAVSQLNSL